MSSSPSWIPENINIRCPEGEPFIDAVVPSSRKSLNFALPSVETTSPISCISSLSKVAASPIACGNMVATPALATPCKAPSTSYMPECQAFRLPVTDRASGSSSPPLLSGLPVLLHVFYLFTHFIVSLSHISFLIISAVIFFHNRLK